MSTVSNDKAFDRAIDLVMHADKVTDLWTGRLLTLQSGLFTAAGALLLWKGTPLSAVVILASALITAAGIISAITLIVIIIREHDTGHSYIEMVKRTEGNDPYLFRALDAPPPGPRFKTVMRWLKRAIVSVWIFYFVMVVVMVATQKAPLDTNSKPAPVIPASLIDGMLQSSKEISK